MQQFVFIQRLSMNLNCKEDRHIFSMYRYYHIKIYIIEQLMCTTKHQIRHGHASWQMLV